MADWSLAVTAPNAERIVAHDLARLSYDHLWFKRRYSALVRGRIIEQTRPAFPRYVFVLADQCWDVLRDVGKVLGVLSFGEEIALIRQPIIDQLIDRCNGTDVFPPEIVPEPFRRGDRVIIGGYGPVAGHEAIYEQVADHGRLRLSFDWFGRLVPIDVDSRDVSVLVSAPKPPKKRRRRGKRRTHASHTPTQVPSPRAG
jgi:transcription antitermination factor NusG